MALGVEMVHRCGVARGQFADVGGIVEMPTQGPAMADASQAAEITLMCSGCPQISAALATTGMDWMGVSDDGFWRPDVRAQFLTGEGAVVAHALHRAGRADRAVFEGRRGRLVDGLARSVHAVVDSVRNRRGSIRLAEHQRVRRPRPASGHWALGTSNIRCSGDVVCRTPHPLSSVRKSVGRRFAKRDARCAAGPADRDRA